MRDPVHTGRINPFERTKGIISNHSYFVRKGLSSVKKKPPGGRESARRNQEKDWIKKFCNTSNLERREVQIKSGLRGVSPDRIRRAPLTVTLMNFFSRVIINYDSMRENRWAEGAIIMIKSKPAEVRQIRANPVGNPNPCVSYRQETKAGHRPVVRGPLQNQRERKAPEPTGNNVTALTKSANNKIVSVAPAEPSKGKLGGVRAKLKLKLKPKPNLRDPAKMVQGKSSTTTIGINLNRYINGREFRMLVDKCLYC